MKKNLCVLLVSSFLSLGLVGLVYATPVTLPGLDGYGYNTIDGSGNGYDGLPGAIGCGPTSGAMVLNYFFGLGDPLSDARAMTAPAYMDTNPDGFGSPSNFHFGLQDYAAFLGYDLDVTLHIDHSLDPTTWGYPADEIVNDMYYFNTDWSVDSTIFLNFVQSEIDGGNPIVVTVDSDLWGTVSDTGFFSGDDHWMVIAGYDRDTEQWAGFNTWDFSLHWYDVTSAFHTGDTQTGGYWYPDATDPNRRYWKQSGEFMGINVVRTMDFNGRIQQHDVPEPTTMLLIGTGLVGVAGAARRKKKNQT